MSFWDGSRWVAERSTPTPSPRRTRTDLAATLVMLIMTVGFVIPWVSAGAAGPRLALSPASGPAGTVVTVAGSGLTPKASVALTWDGSADGMPTAMVNGRGAFKARFTVPSAAADGGHAVSAMVTTGAEPGPTASAGTPDTGSGAVATATFTVAPPASAVPTPGRRSKGAPAPTSTAPSTPTPTIAATETATATLTPAPSAPSTTTPVATATPAATPTAPPIATTAPTATPSATPTPSSTTARASGFVTRCGLYFCLNGSRWSMYAGSDLGGLDDPDARSTLAVAAGLNTLRIVDFLDVKGAPATAPYDSARWQRVDRVIASAGAHGLHVILDLSTYRNLLWNAGLDPYTVDWRAFLQFVATRVNTVTGVRYANDPTIALMAFAGEVEPIDTPSNTRGITTSQVTDFFSRTFAEWKAFDPSHLVSSGGLLQLDWASGIDWKAIFGLSTNDVCSIHDYSTADRTITTPAVAAYCGSIGRPWITEEFGWEQSVGDATRAAAFDTMYDTQVTYHAAGVGFWNLGTQLGGTTYDVNTGTTLTWAAVKAHAP
jgi:hypothetical protein